MASNMKQRDLLLLVIQECGERPEFGRTSLQKVAFFAAEALSRDFHHKAHLYGPYSEDVEDDVDALVESGLIEERTESLAFTGRGGYPGRRYSYSLTDDGRERTEALANAYPEDLAGLRKTVAQLIGAAGSLDQGILSATAKTYYLAKRKDEPLSVRQIQALAAERGWQISREQISQVAVVLQSLGLARKN